VVAVGLAGARALDRAVAGVEQRNPLDALAAGRIAFVSGPSGERGAADIGGAEEAIAAWGRGEELAAEALVSVARTAEADSGALDRSLQALSNISRRRLATTLRELAGEGLDSEEACAELADRIEALADVGPVGPEQELALLRQLVALQPASEDQLASALGEADRVDDEAIAAWARDAQDRGLIEPAEPAPATRRWLITEAGLAAIGLPPAREM
jgi:hypothetical protein